jgi:hypothetical protein
MPDNYPIHAAYRKMPALGLRVTFLKRTLSRMPAKNAAASPFSCVFPFQNGNPDAAVVDWRTPPRPSRSTPACTPHVALLMVTAALAARHGAARPLGCGSIAPGQRLTVHQGELGRKTA